MEAKMTENKHKELVFLMLQTTRLHRKLAEHRAASTEIQPSQHRMLLYLAKNEIVPSQNEIAKKFEISPAAVSNTLKKLEKMGYVEKIQLSDDGDGRVNEIKITEKGKKEVNDTREYFHYIDKAMFNGFTDEEMEALLSLLNRANQNLQSIAESEVAN